MLRLEKKNYSSAVRNIIKMFKLLMNKTERGWKRKVSQSLERKLMSDVFNDLRSTSQAPVNALTKFSAEFSKNSHYSPTQEQTLS